MAKREKGDKLSPEDRAKCKPPDRDRSWDKALGAVQLREIEASLVAHGGNITHTAEALGVSRRYLTIWIKKNGFADRASELRRAAWGRRSALGRPPV